MVQSPLLPMDNVILFHPIWSGMIYLYDMQSNDNIVPKKRSTSQGLRPWYGYLLGKRCPVQLRWALGNWRSGRSGISRNNLWESLKDINLQLGAVGTAMWVTWWIQKKSKISFSSGCLTFLSKLVVFNNYHFINKVNVLCWQNIL